MTKKKKANMKTHKKIKQNVTKKNRLASVKKVLLCYVTIQLKSHMKVDSSPFFQLEFCIALFIPFIIFFSFKQLREQNSF